MRKYLLLLLPTFAREGMGIIFPREPCFCMWLSKLRPAWVGKEEKHPACSAWPGSLSPDLFVGQLKSSLTCTDCGYCSTVFDPFWDLSLPIAKVCSAVVPASASHSGLSKVVTSDLDPFPLQRSYPEVTLMDCMRLFTKEDILDGDEKPVSHSSVTEQPPSRCLIGEGPPSLPTSGPKLFLASFVSRLLDLLPLPSQKTMHKEVLCPEVPKDLGAPYP